MMGRSNNNVVKAPSISTGAQDDVIRVQRLCEIVEELCALTRPALGAHGKGVMISQKSPRQVTITKVRIMPLSSEHYILCLQHVFYYINSSYVTNIYVVCIDICTDEKGIKWHAKQGS